MIILVPAQRLQHAHPYTIGLVRVYPIMKTPYTNAMLFQHPFLCLENRVIFQPGRLIKVIVIRRFMRNDKIGPQLNSLRNHRFRRKHRGDDALDRLFGIARLNSIDRIRKWRSGNIRQQGVDHLADRHIGTHSRSRIIGRGLRRVTSSVPRRSRRQPTDPVIKAGMDSAAIVVKKSRRPQAFGGTRAVKCAFRHIYRYFVPINIKLGLFPLDQPAAMPG